VVDIRIPFWKVCACIGLFFNNFLPANIGDIARVADKLAARTTKAARSRR
jgi:hypothetical protein